MTGADVQYECTYDVYTNMFEQDSTKRKFVKRKIALKNDVGVER